MGARDRLAELKARIPEVTPREALALQARGAVLVDVREADEIAQGTPPGALRLGRGFLELRIEQAVPDPQRPLVLMCGSGTRSLFAADDVARLGYRSVSSMAGGFTRWKHEGLPVEQPPSLDAAARERYSRHLLMPEIGEAGQARLMESKVLLVERAGSARRRPTTWPPRAWARWASSTMTWSSAATCSARSCTPTRASAPRRWPRARQALEALNPASRWSATRRASAARTSSGCWAATTWWSMDRTTSPPATWSTTPA
jgi:rhodanese-related sulfurtransferase